MNESLQTKGGHKYVQFEVGGVKDIQLQKWISRATHEQNVQQTSTEVLAFLYIVSVIFPH